jgi:hypothetical protein
MSRSPSAPTITPDQLEATLQAALDMARRRVEHRSAARARTGLVDAASATAAAGTARPHTARAGTPDFELTDAARQHTARVGVRVAASATDRPHTARAGFGELAASEQTTSRG